jgi:hypothetical protein
MNSIFLRILAIATSALLLSTSASASKEETTSEQPSTVRSAAQSNPETTNDRRPLKRSEVPEPLKSWVPWVLADSSSLACPFVYNSIDERRCIWPGKISLTLNSKSGGTFVYQIQVFNTTQISLPGSEQIWPQSVTVNGKPAQVTGTTPSLSLEAGSYTIQGIFIWNQAPENLTLPSSAGLIELTMDGKSIAQPNLSENNQLWLSRDSTSADRTTATQVNVRVNRLISDEIPMLVKTSFELIVSGKNQEIILPGGLLNGFIPLELKSPLPARVEVDGSIRVQVRAGRWEILLVSRSTGPVLSLKSVALLPTPTSSNGPAAQASVVMPSDEVWAFEAKNELRLVTLEGLTTVDAAQTTLPKEWRVFPAFVNRAGETLKFIESKRGDPQPAPDRLTLKRNIWLDFDGRGYTVQDQIAGTMNSSWRMEMATPSVLGRAAVANTDQFITSLLNTNPTTEKTNPLVGIEVRRGEANVVADSRIETSDREISAVGWQKDFNSVAATLHLPPGWRLIATQGADSSSSAWLTRWTLLDLFLLLLVTLSFGKLFGIQWGAVALLGMALAYQEDGMMVLPWLAALMIVALIRVLPSSGKLLKLMRFSRVAALVLVALTLLPFIVSQVRQAMYPVL